TVLRRAVQTMVHDSLPKAKDDVESEFKLELAVGKSKAYGFWLGREKQRETIPAFSIVGPEYDGTVVVWIHPAGKSSLFHDGKLVPAAQVIIERKALIMAIDVYGTGEMGDGKMPVDSQYAGFTFGYNRPLLAERIHDILTAVAGARLSSKTKRVLLVG